ncbi:sulfite exporter TauE/SafE family protein [Ramlibacter sp. PS3R-8]|uniref:sulfite exporter TauE/SafE family protein n=1 Tax=Ramlibacter sp. PS3R-8 TaxID=3133437 RepID=UPI0030999056
MIDGAYSAAGALTGLLVGLTGVGGGSLMTPILLLFFGVPPATAVATDLWFAALTKMVGARVHSYGGQIDWQVVRRLWAGSLPVAIVVVTVVALGNNVGKLDWLTKAIGVGVLITAAGLLLAPRLLAKARERRLHDPVHFHKLQPPLTVAAGATLGLCVALTSVGAGALGNVMLLFLYPLRMTPHRLVATDIVHAIPLTLAAGTGYLIAGMVDFRMLASMLAGGIPAIIVGSLLARKFSSRWLQVVLALVLVAVGVKTLL